jgi:4-carboxymuconolactone decarboxylase
MPDTPTFGRYAEIPYDQMTPEQQEGYDFAVETRGPLGGPNKIWVHNPKLAKVAAPFGGHFQPGKYSLTEREREIAVVVINSKWHSAYPTAAHERRG